MMVIMISMIRLIAATMESPLLMMIFLRSAYMVAILLVAGTSLICKQVVIATAEG